MSRQNLLIIWTVSYTHLGVLRLIVGGVHIVDAAGKTRVHDGQVLIRQGDVHDQVRLVGLDEGKDVYKRQASISCQHIYKIYPGATAPSVTDFNLEIQDKEFIIFVGPSGCGKSTTLRMIAGLEEISKGEMYIEMCIRDRHKYFDNGR